MLTLNKLCDFKQLLCESSERNQIADFALLGEELGDTLLHKWNQKTTNEDSKDETWQTSIGAYNWNTKQTTVLYTFEEVVNVIQASLNQDHSVLAAVLQNNYLSEGQTDVKYDHQQYKCLLIPLVSQEPPSVLAAHDNLLYVQFRYMKKSVRTDDDADDVPIPSSQLLVCAHKDRISLFNLVWEKSTKSTFSYILRYEYVETVVKAFHWAQWSLTEQCLYYVQFRPPLKLPDNEPDKQLQPMLTCLLFHDSIHYETVMNLPLDLPSLESFSTGISSYEDHPVSHKISDNRLKLGVITRRSGMVCVCHQFVRPLDFVGQQTEHEGASSEEYVDLYYSVTLLHHGCTLTCRIPQVPANLAASSIQFGFYGEDYVLAVLPGQFVHMLDVGLLHGPCNHILVQDSSIVDCHFYFLNSISKEAAPIVVSEDGCVASWLTISTEKFVHLFKNAQHRSTRQAIIHYLLVHLNIDPSVIFKQNLQMLLEEQSHLEMPKILQEFLIGGTYAACKRNLSRSFLSLFPITLAESLDPQIEQGPNQNVQITYLALPHTSMTLLSPSQRLRAAECDIWTNLWRRLDSVRCRPIKRFSSQILRDQIMVSLDYSYQMDSPATTPVDAAPMSPMKKLLEYFQEPCAEIVTNRSRRTSASSETSLSSNGEDLRLPFPEKDDLSCSHFAQVVSTNLREMSVHILKQFSNEHPSHVHQVATEYVANQLQISRLLCSLLLAELEAPVVTYHPRRKKSPYSYLIKLPKKKLCRLFRFLEQYQIATMRIAYPVPQGFSTFFSVLGFTCLDYRMYMQYVARGALQVRSEVASFVVNVLDNQPQNAKIKLDILLRLPKQKAWNLLESWDHPSSHSLQAREHSRAMFGNSNSSQFYASNSLKQAGGSEPGASQGTMAFSTCRRHSLGASDQQGGFEFVPSPFPLELLSSDSGNFPSANRMPDNFTLSLNTFMSFLEVKEIELTGDERNHQKELSMIWKGSFPYNWTKTTCCTSCNHLDNGVTSFKSCINESNDTV